jgi:hypothetical protein
MEDHHVLAQMPILLDKLFPVGADDIGHLARRLVNQDSASIGPRKVSSPQGRLCRI